MSESFARPEFALEADELERFVHSCARERRSPMTHKTMDGRTYRWLEGFVTSYTPGSARTDPVDWPTPVEADYRTLGAFFGRVSARLRQGEARQYASELRDHFDRLAQEVLGWPQGL